MAKGVFTLSKVNRFASAHAWISNRFCQQERGRARERDRGGERLHREYWLCSVHALDFDISVGRVIFKSKCLAGGGEGKAEGEEGRK